MARASCIVGVCIVRARVEWSRGGRMRLRGITRGVGWDPFSNYFELLGMAFQIFILASLVLYVMMAFKSGGSPGKSGNTVGLPKSEQK